MNENRDPSEIQKFSQMAPRWWDLKGECAPLHQINPLRVDFIKKQVNLSGLSVLDVGCGGGILTEALARLGAKVTGIDGSLPALSVAKLHLLESGVQVHYREITVEDLAEESPGTFDVVTCLEMLEHTPDPASVVTACARLVKPSGHVFFSTLNRTFKSFIQAIVGAEYVLQLLPKGTHQFGRFIRPAELLNWARQAGLSPVSHTGITYHPFSKEYALTESLDVNYLMHFSA